MLVIIIIIIIIIKVRVSDRIKVRFRVSISKVSIKCCRVAKVIIKNTVAVCASMS